MRSITLEDLRKAKAKFDAADRKSTKFYGPDGIIMMPPLEASEQKPKPRHDYWNACRRSKY